MEQLNEQQEAKKPLTTLQMMKIGMTNKEIAAATGIRADTISSKRNSYIRKGKLSTKFRYLRANKQGETKLRTKIYTNMEKKLTSLQEKVLPMLIEGKRVRDIAKELNVNYSSVRSCKEAFILQGRIKDDVARKYPAGMQSPGQKAAYTRSLNTTQHTPIVQKPTSDLLFLINGVKVTIRNNVRDLMIGKNEIVINF